LKVDDVPLKAVDPLFDRSGGLTMLTRIFVSLICLSLATGVLLPHSCAADLSRIDRSIKKEPAYQTKKQRYCLLAFGPGADHRIWLVLDGDTLYVDRNGNGDLTEAGESTKPERTDSDPASFRQITIFGPDCKTEEKLDFALYGWFDYKNGKNTSEIGPAVHVRWKNRMFGSWGDETGNCTWAVRPQEAPILLIGGPLQMGFEIPAKHALTRNEKGVFELFVGVGTRGLGKGSFVHLCYSTIPEDVYPTAVLEFPNRIPGETPIRVRTVLKQRC
jgi:hypothetical protein